MSARASIVIPVYGNPALTRRCLDAVLATTEDAEIVVVDDASPNDETPQLLASYGAAIHLLTLAQNEGYATACNRGVAQSSGDLLVLLNNDTVPQPGWLDALIGYADAHPAAAVVGAKLLYPNGTVQHAGVVFGQDGYPHHLYAGLPADHPAVDRPRRLQAVTAACALVRRDAFEGADGFDTGFLNSLEDVDLCLRIGATGGEIHFCPEAVVEHLESATRGRNDRFEASVALYRDRWRNRVRRDDLNAYAEDGLITLEYPDSYPVRMSISAQLAIVDTAREQEIERLLETYARQVSDLLQEVVRLTALQADGAGPSVPVPAQPSSARRATDHDAFLAEARRLEDEVARLQQAVASSEENGFTASTQLGYRETVERIRRAIAERIPAGASVLVVTRGDRDLLLLGDRHGQHFPQDERGEYLGHHPHDSDDAIERLESARSRGARYLVLPPTAGWWLEHYDGLAEHLDQRYERVDCEVCQIYRLDGAHAEAAEGEGR